MVSVKSENCVRVYRCIDCTQILFYYKGLTVKTDSFNKSFLTSFSIL